jgi:hypothetical protein
MIDNGQSVSPDKGPVQQHLVNKAILSQEKAWDICASVSFQVEQCSPCKVSISEHF